MSHYSYQYKQKCIVPCGVKFATPAFTHCHHPCAGHCGSCAPCAAKGPKLYTVRKTLQSSPPCSTPCSSGCVEIVEGSSSPCSPTSLHPCSLARDHLCVPHCGQKSLVRCPQPCAPTPVCQHSSYQWSNCYHYKCGQP